MSFSSKEISSMSSMNSMTEGTSSSNSAPKLPKGEQYAEWKLLMEVHLQKVGANGVHKKPTTREGDEVAG